MKLIIQQNLNEHLLSLNPKKCYDIEPTTLFGTPVNRMYIYPDAPLKYSFTWDRKTEYSGKWLIYRITLEDIPTQIIIKNQQ